MSVLDGVAASSDRLRMDRGALQIDPVPRVSIQAFCETPEVRDSSLRRSPIAEWPRRTSSRTWGRGGSG